MNKTYLLGVICLLLVSSCANSTAEKDALAAQKAELLQKETALAEKEQTLALREQRLLQREDAVVKIEATPETTDMDDSALPTKEDTPLIRLGEHKLSLQWISWDKPGKATITDSGKGFYKIKGEQRSTENTDYLLLDGTLKPINAKQLLFEGKIEYLVHHNNGGKACIKNGPLTFRATGTRQYWRLKEKTNCEGDNLVDYIDIYF